MAIRNTTDPDVLPVMEALPYGLYIVGSRDGDGELNGMMADWVTQVSFEPRLVAVAFENDAHTLANIRENGWFSLNLLPATDGGRDVAQQFAQPYHGSKVAGRSDGERRVHQKMNDIPHATSNHGAPLLSAAMAWLELRAEQFVPAGDHTLVLGEVTAGQRMSSDDPLTLRYTGWKYSG